MISLGIGLVFLVIAVACWVWARDLLSPVFVYPLSWGIVLTGIGLAEPFGYFQIGAEAAAVFLIAAMGFLAGCSVVPATPRSLAESPALNLDFKRLGWFCLVLHLAVIPFALEDIRRIVGNAQDIFQIAFQLRIQSVTGTDSVGFIVANYLTAGLVLVPLFVVGVLFEKWRSWHAVVLSLPWVLLGLLVGGRGGLITIIVASLYVYLSFGGRIGLRAVLGFLFAFVTILIAGNLLVGKIDAGIEDSAREIAAQSLKGFFDYFFAGPILFSGYLQDPTQITPTWDALIFPCHLLSKLSLCSVPEIHQEFLSFNRVGDIGNVYSVVFSIFPKYGFVGLVIIMFFYGFLTAYFHRARHSGIFQLLIAAFLFYATALSIYLDAFAPSIYFFLKVYFISLVLKLAFTTTVTGSNNARRLAT